MQVTQVKQLTAESFVRLDDHVAPVISLLAVASVHVNTRSNQGL